VEVQAPTEFGIACNSVGYEYVAEIYFCGIRISLTEYIDKCRILIAARFSGMTTGTFGLQKAKDENGNRYYYCDLSEYFYGQPRRITAKTLFEMEARLEILREKHNFSADHVLDNPGFPYFYNGTLKNKIDEMQLPEQMKTVFWANFDMLIAGSPKKREQARKVICDFLHVREVFERTEIIEKGRLFIENMEKAEENNDWGNSRRCITFSCWWFDLMYHENFLNKKRRSTCILPSPRWGGAGGEVVNTKF